MDKTQNEILQQVRKDGEPLRRSFTFERQAFDKEKRELTLAFSSDAPVERWFGIEILSHKKEDIDLNRLQNGAPLLMHHNPTDQIGVVDKVWVDDDKTGRAVVRLSKRASLNDLMTDIEDGIVSKVSVGYALKNIVEEKWDDDHKIRSLRWSWEPYEISLVSVAADDKVGIGRNMPEVPAQNKKETPGNPVEGAVMEKEVKAQEVRQETPAPQIDVKAERAGAVKTERDRIAKISELGKAHKVEAEAQKAISEGVSIEDFRSQVLEVLSKRKPESPAIGMSDQEIKGYSFMKAIRVLCNDRTVDAGLEIEASNAVAKRMGRPAKGLFVPFDVQMGPKEQRDLAISGGTGAYFVATDTLAGNFIEALKAKSVLSALGIQYLTGLVGDIAVPKGGTATGYWVAEATAPTESTPTLSQVTGSPKIVGTYVDISRKLMVQSSVDVEAFVRNEIASALAIQIDTKAFTGAGTTEPVGLDNVTNVQDITVTAGTPTYAEMVGFESSVETYNANMGNLAWAMPPAVFWKLATTAVATNAPKFVADYETGMVLGHPCVRSSSVKAKYAYFGSWSQFILGIWGNGLDLTVDPYSNSTTGALRVVGFMDVDVMVRHGYSFAYADVLSS